MTTRSAIHALVDALADEELELARDALREIHEDDVAVTAEDRDELLERQAACDAGDVVGARAFLAALREDRSDSHR